MIKPVARFQKLEGRLVPGPVGILYFVKRNQAFTQELPVRPAPGLVKLATIRTEYDTQGHYMQFRPRLQDVLAQVPERYRARVVAVETETDCFALDGPRVFITTNLYRNRREN